MNEPNPAVSAYIATLPRNEALYAARYAHHLQGPGDIVTARDQAEQTKLGLTSARRLRLRSGVYTAQFGLDETIRIKIFAGL